MRATILNASAGSGKTYRLAYRYVRDVIEQPSLYSSLLAVTFTNKATEEMKSRILSQINTLARGAASGYLNDLCRELSLSEEQVRSRAQRAQANILHDYSRFTVVTIDRFFQRIIRAFIQELGIDLNYNIEIETADILTQGADSLIESMSSDEQLREWLLEFVRERIDGSSRWDIRGAITSLGSEIFNESIEQRLRHSLPREQLREVVQGWESRAASSKEEMVGLAQGAMAMIEREGLTPSDFSGKSRSFALYFSSTARGTITAPTATQRLRAESTEGWVAKGAVVREALLEGLRQTLAAMCALYDRDIKLWNTASLLSENYRSYALLGDLYERVRKISEEQNMMLLQQSKGMLTKFIEDNDAPFIYEKIGNYYSRFLLDEFQDTSSMEWSNLRPLLLNAMAQSEDNTVFIVGDIKQSIYRWRGGDWRILHSGAQQQLGSGDTLVVNLQDNWRSGAVIVEFINNVIAGVVSADNSRLNDMLSAALEQAAISTTLRDELYDVTAKAYASHCQEARRKSGGFVEIKEYSDEPPYIESVKEAIDLGYRPCDIMILTRTRGEGVKVAQHLLEFKASNSEPRYHFDVMTQQALVVGSAPICRFIIALFTLSFDRDNRVELAQYNSFLCSENIDDEISAERSEFLSGLAQMPIVEAFDAAVVEFSLWEYTSQLAFLQAIHEQVISYASGKVGDLMLFVGWWHERGVAASLSVEQSERTIEITTIHKAKGLEKRVVIIPYCSWSVEPKASGVGGTFIWAYEQSVGEFPLRAKSTIAQSYMAEEYYRERVYSHIDAINLLYVALTRAEDALYIYIKSGDSQVGGMLLEALPRCEGADGRLFGEKSEAQQHHDTSDSELFKMRSYPTRHCDMSIALPSQRYREDRGGGFSPRDVGILMHRLFEGATSAQDIESGVDRMVASALISRAEGELIAASFRRALLNPTINEWFTAPWDRVLCEQAIIVPTQQHMRRPDRVMIRGRRAVVVDYKFGEFSSSRYQRQVRGYMELLRGMGYTEVEGWLWHIKSGELEAV